MLLCTIDVFLLWTIVSSFFTASKKYSSVEVGGGEEGKGEHNKYSIGRSSQQSVG